MNPEFWNGRRVFMTGQTGFKGSWLSLWLAGLGASVVGYSDGVPTQPSLYEAASVEDTVTAILGDVRDRGHLSASLARHRPEIVLHLAAQPLVRRSFAEPVLTYETNVLGTVNLLEAVRSIDTVRVVVVVTTDKVYDHVGSKPHSEDDALGGRDPYSTSKACAELVTAAYRASFFDGPDAPAVATARAGNVIGGGDWAVDRLVPDIVGALVEGRPLEIRYPAAIRPWQHVLNPLEGYLVLVERLWDDPSLGTAWNFGPDRADNRPVEWVVQRFGEHWGRPLDVVSPSHAQPPEAAVLELDATRAHEGLDWEPRWDLERGLQATVDWYRSHAEGADARSLTVDQIDSFVREPQTAPLSS